MDLPSWCLLCSFGVGRNVFCCCITELDDNIQLVFSKGGVMHVLKKGFSRHTRMTVSNDGKSFFLDPHLIYHILSHASRNHIHDVYQQLYWCLVCSIIALPILLLVLSNASLLVMAMRMAFYRKGSQIYLSHLDFCYNWRMLADVPLDHQELMDAGSMSYYAVTRRIWQFAWPWLQSAFIIDRQTMSWVLLQSLIKK